MRSSANQPKFFHWGANLVLAVVFLAELLAPGYRPWLYPAVVTLAALACLTAMARQLPLQNVLLAATVTALIGSAAHGLSANPTFAMPFGPIIFGPASGEKIFGLVPWTIPLLWIVAIFAARGVGRLILRPWRKTRSYGWWLIGLTATLVLAFDAALETFARVQHLWIWRLGHISLNWQNAPLVDLVCWFCLTLFILAFITPSLIKKQPGASSAPDIHPLIIWLGALLLFAVGAASAKLWLPVTVDAAMAAITLVLAIRGIRW
jgi:uncharacterized membrane protein